MVVKSQYAKRLKYDKQRKEQRARSDHEKGHGYYVFGCDGCIKAIKADIKAKPKSKKEEDDE